MLEAHKTRMGHWADAACCLCIFVCPNTLYGGCGPEMMATPSPTPLYVSESGAAKLRIVSGAADYVNHTGSMLHFKVNHKAGCIFALARARVVHATKRVKVLCCDARASSMPNQP